MIDNSTKEKITTDTECGDVGKKDTPVPMPNTAVKLLSADGSWTFGPVRVGRCHALLYLLQLTDLTFGLSLFLCSLLKYYTVTCYNQHI